MFAAIYSNKINTLLFIKINRNCEELKKVNILSHKNAYIRI